ncbi:N-methylhydantoinase A/oxoprolinase/acetone carboxylase, beta subunit [Acetitomaculum ruminis DSM 5522]|uniref:N-methylhydantoinase A/oxoprolinase/acetone carboxylase, beta subunit n=1 Tax=Acetitomaculum ruminis DSM 5522 TaxID=1120918 RepID=A0A1I0V968_9FIRM|nr:hydantoinase/oxoprolinase family protein [Acetitomaculum ruminis]SFA72792.1 N-methylhydantoinase A/oxoprolinase/acetone carboxylase, beta subunit [Acetitomaculum ruminis DSM 5522]
MKIGVGIDTGGTYTDAVIYDFENKKVLDSAKTRTTKNDLTICIAKVLDLLNQDILRKTNLIGLSTTMATNACVEGKGGRAKLILWGIDKNTVVNSGAEYGLFDADEIYFQDSYPIYNGGYQKEVDWELFKSNMHEWFDECDSVAVAELFAMNNNALVEKKTKKIISEELNIPVVCGNELFTDLNAIQRGSSVLLNARLIPVIEEFIGAIRKVLKERQIDVPVGIVRSDGSLMSEKFTSVYPVETILCGPAASVMGGITLTDTKNCMVIDMGGTTTDMALVKDKVPVSVTDGVKIGDWKTFVKGLYIDTIGLGGDSAIRYQGEKLVLDTERVIPLCVLASRVPRVKEELKKLLLEKNGSVRNLQEYYVLVKDISENKNYTEKERQFCKILKENGPLCLKEATAKMNSDIYHFKVERLEKEGIIMYAGLTPTDMMHIKGDFSEFDTEAAKIAATYVGNCLRPKLNCDEIAELSYKMVMKKLYVNISRALLEAEDKYFRRNGVDEGTIHYLEKSFDDNYENENKTFFKDTINLNCDIIGIGAPIKIFLPKVCQLLNAKLYIPEHYEVANALGAINGNIIVNETIEIRPVIGGGYTMYSSEENIYFSELNDAKQKAIEILKKETYEKAVERGAGKNNIEFKIEINDGRTMSKEMVRVFTESHVTVTALGRIEF